MRVLLIKTSSMGDIIHTLPALTDAGRAIPGIRFDWVVEKAFAEIPSWHPLVNKVIPMEWRKWRKRFFSKETRQGLAALREQLQTESYDLILDAQGLVKSAMIAWMMPGLRAGLDFRSAREFMASLAYQRRCKVNFYQHAIVRMRRLFSQALLYPMPVSGPDYGLDAKRFSQPSTASPYLVFLHATTWASKQWPEPYWEALAERAAEAGFTVKTSGGNLEELARAHRLAASCHNVESLPRQSIQQMATLLSNARGVVAVDTGFGHLAAALNVPLLSLHGATNPSFTGAQGSSTQVLAATFPCAPCLKRECRYTKPSAVTPACYGTIPPELVWQKLQAMLAHQSL